MKERFIDKSFSVESVKLIVTCNDIMSEYTAEGYDLSLRQLYYQLVSRNIVPNTEQSYKRVGSIISDARLAGMVDWDLISDRGRHAVSNGHWESPADIVMTAARSFMLDRWADQPKHVEVMVEKQALEGVLQPVCSEEDIIFTSNKGYSSSTAMYDAGQRLRRALHAGKECVVLYLGDHDPSGIDMSRDVLQRLTQFSRGDVEVERLALNMDQVKELNPPENPAKMTDSRAAAYVAEFGDSSWELDAIEPRALAQLVRDAVERHRDSSRWEAVVARETSMKVDLTQFAKSYKPRY